MPSARKSEPSSAPPASAGKKHVGKVEAKLEPKRQASNAPKHAAGGVGARDVSPALPKSASSLHSEPKRSASNQGGPESPAPNQQPSPARMQQSSPAPKQQSSPAPKQQPSPTTMRLRDRASASPSPQQSRGESPANGKMKNINAEIVGHGPRIQDNILPSRVDTVVKQHVVVKSPASPLPRSLLAGAPSVAAAAPTSRKEDGLGKRKSPESPNMATKKFKADEKHDKYDAVDQKSPIHQDSRAMTGGSAAVALAQQPSKTAAGYVAGHSPNSTLQPQNSAKKGGSGTPSPRPGSASPGSKPAMPSFSALNSVQPPNSPGKQPTLLTGAQHAHGTSPKVPQAAQIVSAPPATPGKHGAAGQTKVLATEVVGPRTGSPSITSYRDNRAQK